MMVRNEVDNLATKVIGPNAPERTRRLFNAELAQTDNTGVARPYLAEALPQLNSEDWRILPDGRMATIYRLRPSLTWQDGRPLTAEDFAFAWRMYVNPGLAIFSSKPQDLIEGIDTPDPRTLVIHWTATFPDAGALVYDLLPPLPRHILEPLLVAIDEPSGREALLNHSFWTTDYVGAGPFRLTRWQAGYELEGVAFDGHALGRPKIDRLLVRIMNDENTALTTMLAGDADYAEGFLLQFEHALVLQREWVPSGRGAVLVWPDATSNSAVQFRPEYQKSPPLLDVRVRRAMAHAIDRPSINDGVFDGQGMLSEIFVMPQAPYAAETDRAITKYPYDPRRTEQLMTEAGLGRDRDRLFASRAGERFRPDFWITAGAQSERAGAIVAETWRRGGVDAQLFVLSLAAGRDNEVRATFPGLTQVGLNSREEAVENFLCSQIGTAATRWRGQNRGGWVNADVDRLWDAFNRTLDRAERDRQVAEMARIVSEHLPIFTFYPNIRVRAHVAALRGPDVGAPTTLPQWNVHTWEFRS
jgi:peptide/nickel transport system substrate-binding protein